METTNQLGWFALFFGSWIATMVGWTIIEIIAPNRKRKKDKLTSASEPTADNY